MLGRMSGIQRIPAFLGVCLLAVLFNGRGIMSSPEEKEEFTEKDKLVLRASLAYSVQRFDDMAAAVKALFESGSKLEAKDRNILLMAYNMGVDERKASLENIKRSEMISNEEASREYIAKIQNEIKDKCHEFLTLIDKVQMNETDEKVMNLLVKGDFNKNLVEVSTGAERDKYVKQSQDLYQQASDLSKSEMTPTKPLRLNIALHFSNFYYNILNNRTKACQIVKEAVKEAKPELANLNDDDLEEAIKKIASLRSKFPLYCMSSPDEKDDLTRKAAVTYKLKRFDDMAAAMKGAVETGFELNIDDRNLLATAYSLAVDERRDSLIAVKDIENQSEQDKQSSRKYREKIEKEIKEKCLEFLSIFDEIPIHRSEDIVFNVKTEGDFYTYLAEVSTDDEREKYLQLSHELYQRAYDLSNVALEPTHPLRLGTAITLSEFNFDILKDENTACRMARIAVRDAEPHLNHLRGEQFDVAYEKVGSLKKDIDEFCISSQDKGTLTLRASIAFKLERFDDMIAAMKEVVESGFLLDTDDRNFLVTAYSLAVEQRRKSKNSIEDIKTEFGQKYREKIEKEIRDLCIDFLVLFRNVPNYDDEDKVYNYRTRGDFLKYLAEVSPGAKKDTFIKQAKGSYERAYALSIKKMVPTYPLRLGTAITFSEFYFETLHDDFRGCHIAMRAVAEAGPLLDDLRGDDLSVANEKISDLQGKISQYCKRSSTKDFSSKDSSFQKEQFVIQASLAFTVQRYDDMAAAMKAAVQTGERLNIDNRNFLVTAYSLGVNERRNALRTVKSMEMQSNNVEQYDGQACSAYRKKIENEIRHMCVEFLRLFSRVPIFGDDDMIFNYRTKGDFFKYLAEVSYGAGDFVKQSEQNYQQAYEKSKNILEPIDPLRLGTAINFSEFYFEILQDKPRACKIVEEALEKATPKLINLKGSEDFHVINEKISSLKETIPVYCKKIFVNN